jgi:uncharacterized membrane protein
MEIIVLRLVHIIGGIVWVGAGVFNAVFLMPALRQAGPAAGQVMGALRARRLFIFLPVVALLTIVSGVRLMMIVSGGFQAAWFQSASGSAFAWSGLIALVVFVLGLTVVGPMGNRMAKLGAELAQTKDEATRKALAPKFATLQKRMSLLGFVLTALILLAAAGMSVARYLR